MTTGWGDVGHWEAPRVAYELAADWAEELAARRGGAGGQHLCDPPPLGKAWIDLRLAERRDVLTAMGAQTRAAIVALGEQAAQQTGVRNMRFEVDLTYFGQRMCEQAVAALDAAATSDRMWEMPECAHCADLMALGLVALHHQAIETTGVGSPAVVLRRMADVAGQRMLPGPPLSQGPPRREVAGRPFRLPG